MIGISNKMIFDGCLADLATINGSRQFILTINKAIDNHECYQALKSLLTYTKEQDIKYLYQQIKKNDDEQILIIDQAKKPLYHKALLTLQHCILDEYHYNYNQQIEQLIDIYIIIINI